MASTTRPQTVTLERAASMEALIRARFFAFNQKRTLPPRLSPVGILLLILTAGVVFIGLTITIVANWPGLATLGENRLRIAGPVLLAVGFAGFLLSACFMWIWVSGQNKKWEKDMTEKAQQYIASQSQEPLVDASVVDRQRQEQQNPNRWSADSYRNNSGSNYDQINVRLPGEHRMVINGIPVKQPINGLGKSVKQSSKADQDSSFDSQNTVPDPVRVQKKRKSDLNTSGSTMGSVNQSYSAGEGDMSIPGISPGHPKSNNQIYANAPDQQQLRHERRIKTTTTTITTTKEVRKKGYDDDLQNYHRGQVDPIRRPLEKNQDEPSRGLRVLIKAQPGTAVHITPSSTPPTGGHPARISMDTEI